jgi:hypothetical protein
MPDQQLMPLRPAIRGQQRPQVQFNAIRIVARGKAKSVRQSANVSIHRKRVFAAQMDADHAGGLVANAWKGFQLRAGGRDSSLVTLEQDLGSGDQIARLGAIQPAAFDQAFQLRDPCPCVALRSGVAPKQCGRDQVHAAIGALRGKNHRDQKLQGGSVIQRDLRAGHVRVESIHDQGGSPSLFPLGLSGHALS